MEALLRSLAAVRDRRGAPKCTPNSLPWPGNLASFRDCWREVTSHRLASSPLARIHGTPDSSHSKRLATLTHRPDLGSC